MPKYLMLIVETEAAYAEAGEAEFAECMAEHNAFAEEVTAAGATMLGGEALQPTATASYLRGTRTADVQTVDNPLPELKEVVGGYYLVEAADDAAALELAKRCPAPLRLHRAATDLGIRRLTGASRRRRASPRWRPGPSGSCPAGCWRSPCGRSGTWTSPRRRPPTRSCWRCRPGRNAVFRPRSRRGW